MSLSSSAFIEGFAKSASMTVVSEIGDKTFFIAAVMAMKHPRSAVFIGAWLALAVMTALSAVVGSAAPRLIDPATTRACATALFFVFGARAVFEAVGASDGESELTEVEAEFATRGRRTSTRMTRSSSAAAKTRGGIAKKAPARSASRSTFAEAFVVTFCAEWGDRSQIATIGLAAASDVLGVTLGGILAHAACTGLAVIGGRHLASKVNERFVGGAGGVLFLLFGAHALFTA